jgi:alkaline phosphatase D
MKRDKINLLLYGLGLSILFSCQSGDSDGPWMATGIKIGEVSQTEAIIWVRLTENPERVGDDASLPDVKYIDPESGNLIERLGRPDMTPVVTYPEGYSIRNIQGACPGSQGMARVKYKIVDEARWKSLDWQKVEPEKDFTYQFPLSGLTPGETYELMVEAKPLKGRKVSASLEGEFKTAPLADKQSEVNFIVTTGTSYPDVDSENGYKFYVSSLKLDPEFCTYG